ncbi:MAG TPA: TadE family protein [Caulobacteraceae bacterium]|jgi:Flp pilus assembly protein TadG
MFHLARLLGAVAPSRWPRPTVAPAALAADTRGVAALEMTLAMPFMILLLMGVFDFGTYAYDTMQVNAAAAAGAQAAVAAAQNHLACTPSTITSAETSATALKNLATSSGGNGVAVQGPNCSYSAYVLTTNGVSTLGTTCPPSPSATTCTGPGAYAVAYAQAPYSPLLSWSGLVLPSTISATATVRYG